jgi:hypothetical protein
MDERGESVTLTERERASRHFNVEISAVTSEMIEQLPPRGTGLETGRAQGSNKSIDKFEEQAKSAMDKLIKLYPEDWRLPWQVILSTHMRDSFNAASRCELSPMLKHQRELGEENHQVEELVQDLVKTKVVNQDRAGAISEAIVDFWTAMDSWLGETLQEYCSCKLR